MGFGCGCSWSLLLKISGVRGMEYILLSFAFGDNADMGMCVTSVNPSKGILPVKFLTPSPHSLFLYPEVLSLEC